MSRIVDVSAGDEESRRGEREAAKKVCDALVREREQEHYGKMIWYAAETETVRTTAEIDENFGDMAN